MPPKRKPSGGKTPSAPSAASLSKQAWKIFRKRNLALAEEVEAVIGSPKFNAAEIRKITRLSDGTGMLVIRAAPLNEYRAALHLGQKVRNVLLAAKFITRAIKTHKYTASAAVRDALTNVLDASIGQGGADMARLIGQQAQVLQTGLGAAMEHIVRGNIRAAEFPAAMQHAVEDLVFNAGTAATWRQVVSEMKLPQALGAAINAVSAAYQVTAQSADPFPGSVARAARGAARGSIKCPAGTIPNIVWAGNGAEPTSGPFIKRGGKTMLRSGYEVQGCHAAADMSEFGASTISALVGDEGLAGLAQIAPGQAFRAKSKRRAGTMKKSKRKSAAKKKAAAAAAKKPKGKGFAKTATKMPARVAIKGKKGKKKWVHRRVYRLTRSRPCEGSRKARAKGALFIKKSVKVPGTSKRRIVMLFVTKTDVARSKAALARAKAMSKKRKAPKRKAAKRKVGSRSRARALLADASAFDAKKKRKRKSKSKKSSTKASRSAAAKKAWRTRRKRHGKTGLTKKHRAK